MFSLSLPFFPCFVHFLSSFLMAWTCLYISCNLDLYYYFIAYFVCSVSRSLVYPPTSLIPSFDLRLSSFFMACPYILLSWPPYLRIGYWLSSFLFTSFISHFVHSSLWWRLVSSLNRLPAGVYPLTRFPSRPRPSVRRPQPSSSWTCVVFEGAARGHAGLRGKCCLRSSQGCRRITLHTLEPSRQVPRTSRTSTTSPATSRFRLSAPAISYLPVSICHFFFTSSSWCLLFHTFAHHHLSFLRLKLFCYTPWCLYLPTCHFSCLYTCLVVSLHTFMPPYLSTCYIFLASVSVSFPPHTIMSSYLSTCQTFYTSTPVTSSHPTPLCLLNHLHVTLFIPVHLSSSSTSS